MSDFEMKYKGSELQALVEGSASSLFYAGTVEAAYSIPGLNGAQVSVSQAFRTKYGIGENKEVFYIVDKRMIAGDDSNEVYIYPADFEGCYFVMGDFEGNDAIFGLGAAKGDWVVVQGREWVKIITTQREIAGISGEVTTEALAQKLSTPTLENTKPLATKEEILQSDWLDRDTASKAFVKNKPFGVIAQTSIIQLNLSADTIGTDISILSETLPFYVAGSVYYAKDVLDQDIVINTTGPGLKVRVVKEGNNYYLRHVYGETQVEDIAFISNVKLQKLSSGYISDEIARVGSEFDGSSENTIFGVKAYIDEQKNMLINEYMNVKPTVKIFHSTDTDHSMVYAYHPYCEQFGEGELVVMRYGKTKSRRKKQIGEEFSDFYVTKTGWRECLGAPRNLPNVFEDLKSERYNEPAKLSIGWSLYLDVVEEICKRATVVRELIDSEDGTEHFEGIVSMAQVLKLGLGYKSALQVLHERYYELWEMTQVETNKKPEWSIFGGSRDKLNLGVALRVLNPEFQKLLDDGKIIKDEFMNRRWYYDSGPGKMIPKYLYSEVCEMVMTTGSLAEMQDLDQPYCPRLTLKG